MKKMQLFMGLYLAMQAMTCLMLVILFLFRGKKNSAGVFMTAGAVSGICGALMIYKQIRAKLEDNRISALIDELLASDDEPVLTMEEQEIPLDESATETEFQA